MKKSNSFGWVILTILMVASLLMGSTRTVRAQERIADVLAEALELYQWADFDKGIDKANSVLARGDLSPKDSIAVYEVLSIIYNAKGDKYKQEALEYLEKISKIGPCLLTLPRDNWPSGLRQDWYKITYDDMKTFTCSSPSNSDTTSAKIQTIAVLPFDNNSVGDYQQKLGGLGAGLAQGFLADFKKVSSLKVVERDKIQFIIDEINIAKSGIVDDATAIKAGKILSAHLMVFGAFTQISDKSTMMTARVVKVETSEVIAVLSQQGGSNYFEMEKELVKQICAELDILLSDKETKEVEMGGSDSFDATAQFAMGLQFEDKYDYAQAYEHFQRAVEIDPDFSEAKKKVDVYRPFII